MELRNKITDSQLYKTCCIPKFIKSYGVYICLTEYGNLYKFGKNYYITSNNEVFGVRGSVCIK